MTRLAEPWWMDRARDAQPWSGRLLWPWRRRRPARVAPPLRISDVLGSAAPVGSLGQLQGGTSPVEVLFHGNAYIPRSSASVNLESRLDQTPAPPQIRQPKGPQSERDAPSSPQEQTGPSLADRLRVRLAVPLASLLPGPATTLDWPAHLMEFQLEGVRELLRRDRILLADDMGLGKTIQAIAAVRILCIQRMLETILVVAPASLIDQWRREFHRWAPELRLIVVRGSATDRAWQWKAEAHVTIVSYETLRSDCAGGSEAPPRRRIWDLVVLDEAQKIKNRDVEISRVTKQLRRRRSWALTGTPLENHLDELASILEFVDQGEETSTKKYTPTPRLLDRHRDLQLRRRKQDVLDQLPPKQVVNLAIPLLPAQQASYDRAERDGIVRLRELGRTIRIQHVLELITRLKQICNADPETGESAKFADIQERMSTLSEEGHRALLFSQYTDNSFGVGAIASALEDFKPLTYTGAMSGAERDHVIQRFKNDPTHKALILSLKAGGVGLNLQEASYVFHVDRWWNPAIERQAEDRTHRMGQVVPVTVFKYTCENTIEERIQNILARKQQIFDEIVDDVSLDVASRLTRDEMFGLFGLEPPGAPEHERDRPTGLELEERCASILRSNGWSVEATPRSRDGGVDLIATRFDEIGLEQKLYIQCKDHARPVGIEVVRELLGVIPAGSAVRAVLAAPGGVTADAARLAAERGVKIWDEAALNELESRSGADAQQT